MFRKVLPILAAAIIFTAGCAKKPVASDGSNLDRYYDIELRDLVIGVEESGTVSSVKNHKLRYDASYSTQISWVIEENSEIKKDQLLIKFDAEELVSMIEEFETNLENERKELKIAEEELAIQESENLADIRSAQDNVVDAEDALYKYLKLEGPKAKDAQTVSVENAREQLKDAEKAYSDAYAEFKTTVYDNQDDQDAAKERLERLQSNIDKEKLSYENVLVDDKIFRRYDYPNRITSLENALEQSKLNLQKIQVRAQSMMIQKQNQVQRYKNNIARIESELARHKEYLTQMEIYSPSDGVILYGDTDRRWDDTDLKEGMQVRRGQILATIPDLSELMVYMDLPEIYRSRVNVGDETIVTVESVPGLALSGTIVEISPLPENQLMWDPTSPKIYKTKILLPNKDKRMVTGMNVQVKVINERLKGVIAVPIEAVFEKDGRLFVYKHEDDKDEIRYVEIGQSDNDYVCITSGLKVGDRVCLFEPVD
ncbi:MAG: efflux RND transporter periplasmic adaptor subunit [Phycisphaerae bacterium]|jgi:RND family efflux transporter MFP subunit